MFFPLPTFPICVRQNYRKCDVHMAYDQNKYSFLVILQLLGLRQEQEHLLDKTSAWNFFPHHYSEGFSSPVILRSLLVKTLSAISNALLFYTYCVCHTVTVLPPTPETFLIISSSLRMSPSLSQGITRLIHMEEYKSHKAMCAQGLNSWTWKHSTKQVPANTWVSDLCS